MLKARNLTCNFIILVLMLTIIFGANTAYAETVEDANSYSVQLVDDAGLFTDKEIEEIKEAMKPFAQYGNALLVTTNQNNFSSVQELAIDYYDKSYGISNGAVFLIDMYDRELYWCSQEDICDTITGQKALTITDNVYKFASDGDYKTCSIKAFEQAITILEGGRIAQKMKYIGNAFLAIILAILINYIFVRKTMTFQNASASQNRDTYFTASIDEIKIKDLSPTRHELPKRSFGKVYPGSGGGGYSDHSGSSSSSSRSSSSSSSSSRSSSSSSSSSHSSSSGSSRRSSGGGHRF